MQDELLLKIKIEISLRKPVLFKTFILIDYHLTCEYTLIVNADTIEYLC